MSHHLARYTRHPAYLARITPPALPSDMSRHQDPRQPIERKPDPVAELRVQPPIKRNSSTDRVRVLLEDVARAGAALPYIPDIAKKLAVHPDLVRAAIGNLRTMGYIRTKSRQLGANLPAEWICAIKVDGETILLRSKHTEHLSFNEQEEFLPVLSGSPAARLYAVLQAINNPLPLSGRMSELCDINSKRMAEVYRALAASEMIEVETQPPRGNLGYQYRVRIVETGKVLRTAGWKD